MLKKETQDDCPPIPHYENLDVLYWTTFQVVFPILIVLGIICNIINLVVLTRRRMMNKIYKWLRVMAVADIGLCIFLIPVCVANCGHTYSNFFIAKYYAIFGWSLAAICQNTSFYLMVWFAYNRYLAVCNYDKYPESLRDEVYRNRLSVTILFVVAIHVPTMFFGEVCEINDSEYLALDGYRHVGNDWYEAYSWIRELLSRVVPPVLLTFFNIKIWLRLRSLQNTRDGFVSEVPPSRRNKERKLVALLFWGTALFYVYQTPVTVYLLLLLRNSWTKEQKEQILLYGVISNIIQMIGNISNFTLYFFVNPQFHNTFKVVFCGSVPDTADDSEREKSQSQSQAPSRIHRVVNDLSESGVNVDPSVKQLP